MPEPPRRWAVWLGAFVVAAALYIATANRGPQWQDSGWQQLRIVTGQLEHPYGLPLCHPVQYYLGRLAVRISFLEPAFAITLVSSLAAALAIANVTLTLTLLTRRIVPGAVATAALLLSHTYWRHASYTECYAVTAALLSAEWLCLAYLVTTGRSRCLLLLALLNGLGIANHLLAAVATPVDLVLILWALRRGRLPGRLAIAAGALWLVGTLPYSGLVIGHLLQSGDIRGTVQAALFGNYTVQVLNTQLHAGALLLSLGYVVYNFPGLTIPLALVALLRRNLLPRAAKYALLAQLALYLLFALRYPVRDQYAFFFPAYMLLAVFAGVGLANLPSMPAARMLRRAVIALALITAAWTPLVYLTAARVLAGRGILTSMVQNKPYRDGYRTFFVPWGRGADHATKLNNAVRGLAGDDGLILIGDHMIEFGVRYSQALGRIPGNVEVLGITPSGTGERVAEWRAKLSGALDADRSVVLVPRDRDKPQTCVPEAQWSRFGDVYRLTGLVAPTSRRREAEPPRP